LPSSWWFQESLRSPHSILLGSSEFWDHQEGVRKRLGPCLLFEKLL
jgi:hypothetical protein